MKDMKNTALLSLLLLFTLLLLTSVEADAKWWIFGKAEDAGVSTRYIYLNDLSYDELGEKVVLYQESLPQGKIFIRGKGSAGKNQIGAVQVSLDGKQSWQKAQVASDGSFLYSFAPEVGQTYELYVKVLDTTGKSNDIEASRKELTISADSTQDTIYQVLDQLFKAYIDEDSFAFMRLVSDDFVSGTALLDSAIRQDFSAFDNIQLHYTLNNVTRGGNGNLFVALSFSRMVTSSRSGQTFSDQASTEFTFKLEGDKPRLYSMKNPLIFGLSDAGNIATGTINSGENSKVIILDNSGTVSTATIAEIDSGMGNTAKTTVAGSITLHEVEDTTNPLFPALVSTPDRGYIFSTQSYVETFTPGGDIYLHLNEVKTAAGVTDLGYCTLANQAVPTVPQGTDIIIVGDPGRCWALSLTGGGFVVLQDNGWNETISGQIYTRTANLSYKYLAP
ncbi:MAG: hypothetical protein Kow00100_14860 [Geothermobacteraceae bacterium]